MMMMMRRAVRPCWQTPAWRSTVALVIGIVRDVSTRIAPDRATLAEVDLLRDAVAWLDAEARETMTRIRAGRIRGDLAELSAIMTGVIALGRMARWEPGRGAKYFGDLVAMSASAEVGTDYWAREGVTAEWADAGWQSLDRRMLTWAATGTDPDGYRGMDITL